MSIENFHSTQIGTSELICGDVVDSLESLEGRSYQLIVSSPPYNIGKVYERDSKRTLDEYSEWQFNVVKGLKGLLADNGSICWQVGSFVRNNEYVPLDIIFYRIFAELGFKLRNRIIWRFNFGLNYDKRFSGRYETMLWFTKSDDYVFNLDPVRIPQLYPGKRHVQTKGAEKAGKPSGNPLGKNPSDYWEFSAERDFMANPVWDLPNVKASHPEKTSHPCQFPIELAERCVLAFTNPGDAVLDPFVGTGASLIAAKKHGRVATGIDRDAPFLAIAGERLEAFESGVLPMRPSGKAVQRPNPKDKVARVPVEWEAKVG
ncbi:MULTISPECIES: DNA-methyltransferase [Rhizobium]|uniref:DNA-methyltransferase n=1 Tax=Rhizobium TaxID=379 RepID=UPI00102F4647|nr:site-specific DNA-methyltransferase [Rhizobium ruizarguesonis]MBY5886054.1 site-specific DNA-methyltransferase [Rhizobium leguminosarum]QSZ04558.1 site-specific DNA-methyltransferase [Rhizobium ruizarguesonis]TBA11030.1 site-specific DNA-methyltransferase [Rhizobium ruizarguesonis]